MLTEIRFTADNFQVFISARKSRAQLKMGSDCNIFAHSLTKVFFCRNFCLANIYHFDPVSQTDVF